MKIQILGNGAFGSFLHTLLADQFEIVDDADSVILAVPAAAYKECGEKLQGKHLINVCSIQTKTTDDLLFSTSRITGIHPLFGARTPKEKRNAIVTYLCGTAPELEFIKRFKGIASMSCMSPEEHDGLMARTHKAAAEAAIELRKYVDAAKDVPDDLIPHSFRLLRQFVQTLEDMPAGTIESIMANPISPRFDLSTCFTSVIQALDRLAKEYEAQGHNALAREARAIAGVQLIRRESVEAFKSYET